MVRKMMLSLMVLVGMLFVPSSVRASSPIFEDVTSYQIYYDPVTTKIEKDMRRYDLVILEPREVTKEQVSRIQNSGTMVLGYVNVMEADEWNVEVMKQLQEEDFFYRNGEKVFFPEWNSYLMDLTSSHYQSVLRTDLKAQVIDKGFDGIFFDTVGDIDDQHSQNSTVLTAQRNAYVELLKFVRHEYGQIPIIQNWGFDTLKTTSAPYVDGVMWEGFQYSAVACDEWSQNRIADLIRLRAKYDIDVFTVSYKSKKKSMTYARERGFIHTHEPDHYNQWTYVK
ncbi:endo alpha-1,4 polygalactosaminidase [Pontibacillus salipaludis]|uniref:endo alpha-1,4 polygalactosaminidase n=1 Tax=Pontibacillus salipaludis TaxID=1697394 RepID=UPI0031EDF242